MAWSTAMYARNVPEAANRPMSTTGHADTAAGPDVHVRDDVVPEPERLDLGGLRSVEPPGVVGGQVVQRLGDADPGGPGLHRPDLGREERVVLLIPELDVPDPVRLGVAVGDPPGAPLGGGVAVAVLDEVGLGGTGREERG